MDKSFVQRTIIAYDKTIHGGSRMSRLQLWERAEQYEMGWLSNSSLLVTVDCGVRDSVTLWRDLEQGVSAGMNSPLKKKKSPWCVSKRCCYMHKSICDVGRVLLFWNALDHFLFIRKDPYASLF